MSLANGVSWLLFAAIVLIVLAIVATASASATALGVAWTTWLCASVLAWLVARFVVDGAGVKTG
jgi:high-affinity Fe2+/Pb2+ permease